MNEKELTWNMVTEQINLGKLQIRTILSLLNRKEPAPDGAVEDVILITLLVAELLEQIRLTAEQRNLILLETRDTVDAVIMYDQLAQLCLVDGVYCAATGVTGFIDLNTGDKITDKLPIPPLETISYNLNELWRRGRQRILNRSGQNATGQQNADANVAEPANVRPGATDGVS